LRQALALVLLVGFGSIPALASVIKVTGYEIVADRALLDRIKPLKPQFLANLGKPYSRSLLLEDVRRFQLLGNVGMVRTARKPYKSGQKLLYRVEANPKIRSIRLVGVTCFSADEVLGRFTSKPGQILDYTRLFTDINTIPSIYLEKKGIMYADVIDQKDVAIRDGHVTITVREFKMGDLVIKGVKGAEADLVRRTFQVRKGQPIHRNKLLSSLCDIYQLSTVKDLDWYPRFDKPKAVVTMVLHVIPADRTREFTGIRGRSD